MKPMRRLRYIFLASVLSLLSATAFAARTWESVERMPVPVSESVVQSDDIVAVVSEGYLYITVKQRTTVRLFTILGQPVVQETLVPGTYRFRLTTRGIYLLKAGGATRRITL